MRHEIPDELRQRFEVRGVLGAGGMGTVLHAYEPALDRDVALKLALRPSPLVLERMRREGRILSEVRHPHVVEVYDLGVAGDQAYLVMEHLDGVPLDEVPEDLVVPAILDIASALEVLHARGLVHRDVKPQNILCTRGGRAVLIDFGLVKPPEATAMTATGALVGTLPFLPPEAHRGEELGPPADWYALGISLYWLFEDGPPWGNAEVLAGLRGEAPPLRFHRLPPHGPVARMIRGCLAADPAARPRSRRQLEALREGGPRPTTSAPGARSGALDPLDPPSLGRPVLLAGVALFLLGVGIGAVRSRLALAPPAPSLPAAPPAPTLPPGMAELGRNAEGRRQARNLIDDAVLILVPAATIQARGQVVKDAIEVGPGPPRRVEVPALWVDKYEVTVARYERYLTATGAPPPSAWEIQLEEPLNPVCFVGIEESMAYARWAGGRLPTTDEWERIATGAAGSRYAWGDEPPGPEHGHYDQPEILALTNGPRALRPVGSYPRGASPDGVMDLMGNVAEWLHPQPIPGRPDFAFLVGGGLMRRSETLATWSLRAWHRLQVGVGTGFRIVRDHLAEAPSPERPR